MCVTTNKIKVELYLTPEELIDLGKFLKKKNVSLQSTEDGGEETEGGNQ